MILPLETMNIDVKTELIQTLIPLGLWHVKEVLEQEAIALTEEQYSRKGETPLRSYERSQEPQDRGGTILKTREVCLSGPSPFPENSALRDMPTLI